MLLNITTQIAYFLQLFWQTEALTLDDSAKACITFTVFLTSSAIFFQILTLYTIYGWQRQCGKAASKSDALHGIHFPQCLLDTWRPQYSYPDTEHWYWSKFWVAKSASMNTIQRLLVCLFCPDSTCYKAQLQCQILISKPLSENLNKHTSLWYLLSVHVTSIYKGLRFFTVSPCEHET